MKTRRLLLPLLVLAAALPARAFELRLSSESTNALSYTADTHFDSEALLAAYDISNAASAARDLWLIANSVRQSGPVAQDARIAAKSAVVDGAVGQNLEIFAQAAQLTTNATVAGDMALLGGTLVSEGTVSGDAWLSGREVTLSGTYGGRVRVIADTLRVSPGTRIAGDFVYTTPSAFALPPGVEVGGQVRAAATAPAPKRSLRDALSVRGIFFMGALLVGMPFVAFFPAAAGGSVRAIRRTPWRCLFTGLAMLFVGPVVLAIAAVTVIGLPLALVGGAFWLLTFYLSHIVIALLLGHWLVGRRAAIQTFSSVFLSLGAGLFLLYFASALPHVTDILAMPVLVLGMGALWRNIFHPVAIRAIPPIPPPANTPPPLPPDSPV
jgi:hypothetical protein